jgi:repressor LexA
MSEKPLSKRQQSMLEFIANYIHDHTRPPTIREIGEAVGISSTSVVNYNLTRLEEKGLLEREAEVSRGLRLTQTAANGFRAAGRAINVAAETLNDTLNRLISIPIAGDIVASQPLEVGSDVGVNYYEDFIEVSASMLRGRADDLYALRVNGDSMIDAMVQDGDIVVMHKQQTANNGDMVAVWLRNGTTTLKHFHHEGNRIRLQPANPTMEPIYVEPEEVQVQGKVMMVVRQSP